MLGYYNYFLEHSVGGQNGFVMAVSLLCCTCDCPCSGGWVGCVAGAAGGWDRSQQSYCAGRGTVRTPPGG